MRCRQRNIDEEPFIAVVFDELYRAIEKHSPEYFLLRIEFDDRIAIIKRQIWHSLAQWEICALSGIARQFGTCSRSDKARVFVGCRRLVGMEWPHVIGIRDPVKLVEAMALRPVLVMIAKVPLAENARRIASSLEHFGQRNLVRVNTDGTAGGVVPAAAESRCIGTGHQHGPRQAAAR